jgi:hypothetical protein
MAQAQSKVREMVVGGADAPAAAPVTAPTKAPTEAVVKARVEALVKTALDEAMARARPERAEPEDWWNLFASHQGR